MADVLVNLAALPDIAPIIAEQQAKGVKIRRGQPEESQQIGEWVREHINPNWATGCEVALEQQPVTCFVAIVAAEASDSANGSNVLRAESIVGFACYDVVKKGVFGPTGVREDYQQSGVDTALLLVCLHEMAELDYGQAVIGWTAFVDGTNRTNFDNTA